MLLYANSPDCKTKSIVQADVDLCLHVQTEIYKLYGKAYGWYSLLSLCFFWASEQSTNILTSWWLSQWTTAQILYQIEANAGECPLQRLTFASFSLSCLKLLFDHVSGCMLSCAAAVVITTMGRSCSHPCAWAIAAPQSDVLLGLCFKCCKQKELVSCTRFTCPTCLICPLVHAD